MQQQTANLYQHESLVSTYNCVEAVGPMLDRVYSLRYKAYSERGFIGESDSYKFMDEYDRQASCRSFLLYSGGKAVASLRTCLYKPSESSDVPALSIFREEIATDIGMGSTFVEINKFVVDPDVQRKGGIELRFQIFKVAVENALEEGAGAIVIAVRSEHVRFYRMLRCFPMSESKMYPGLNFETVLLASTDLHRSLDIINSKLNRKSL